MAHNAMLSTIIGVWAGKPGGPPPPSFRAVAVGTENWYRCTGDIADGWLLITKPFAQALGVAYSGALKRFVVGSYSTAETAYSDDGGATWTTVAMPTGLQAVIWIPSQNQFVAFGPSVCYTSPDGITWTPRTIAAVSWNSAAFSPTLGSGQGRILVVGGNTFAYSDDSGVTWTAGTALTATNIPGVIWSDNDSIFVLASRTGSSVMTSPDGIVWTERATGVPSNSPAQNTIDFDFLVSPQGLTTGLKSVDGITWTAGSMFAGSQPVLKWARDRSAFISGGFTTGLFFSILPTGGWTGCTVAGVATAGSMYGIATTDSVANPDAP